MLNLIDEHSRECLLIRCERRWSSAKVIEALADVMVIKGVPEHIRSDNGPEFEARDLRKWLADTGAKTLYIEPGSPWAALVAGLPPAGAAGLGRNELGERGSRIRYAHPAALSPHDGYLNSEIAALH